MKAEGGRGGLSFAFKLFSQLKECDLSLELCCRQLDLLDLSILLPPSPVAKSVKRFVIGSGGNALLPRGGERDN